MVVNKTYRECHYSKYPAYLSGPESRGADFKKTSMLARSSFH